MIIKNMDELNSAIEQMSWWSELEKKEIMEEVKEIFRTTTKTPRQALEIVRERLLSRGILFDLEDKY